MPTLSYILRRIPVLLLPALLVFGGCSDEECEGNRSSLPLASFYLSGTNQRISLDAVTIYGLGAPGDSMLVEGSRNLSEIYLPFNLDSDETRFALRNDTSAIADTITFRYSMEPRFVSASCGVICIFDIEDISATGNMIDSVVCPDMRIDNRPGDNIQIYFRNSDGETEVSQ